MDISKVAEDAFHLCLDILQTQGRYDNDSGVRTIAMENATRQLTGSTTPIAISFIDFIYNERETPLFLEKEKIITISKESSPFAITTPLHPKGYYLITFNFNKAQEWIDKILKEKGYYDDQKYDEPIWTDKFEFIKDTLYLPPFGQHKFSDKNRPNEQSVNKRSFLVKIITQAGKNGLTKYQINNKFKEYNIEDILDDLEPMINQINNLFSPEKFSGAHIRLIKEEVTGTVHIKLSVRPPKS